MSNNVNIAEFYLSNGNHILFYHTANVVDLITEYEEQLKDPIGLFFVGNWGDYIKELYYNGRRLEETNFSFPVAKVDLHKFEG